MTWSFAGLRARFLGLLHLDDPPHRLACALAVGVFISCTPFWGLQTVLAIVVAGVFRLNRAVTIMGMWINLPWFAPFVFGAAIKVGVLVAPGLREADAASLDALLRDPSALSWATVWSWVRGSSLPLLIGSAIVGSVAAAVTYTVAFAALARRRRAQPPPGGPGGQGGPGGGQGGPEATDASRRHVA